MISDGAARTRSLHRLSWRNPHCAFAWLVVRGQTAKQRRFAGARWAGERHALASVNVEVDVVEHEETGAALGMKREGLRQCSHGNRHVVGGIGRTGRNDGGRGFEEGHGTSTEETRSWVYACCGSSSTRSVRPPSTTSPPCITSSRSARSRATTEVMGHDDGSESEVVDESAQEVEESCLNGDVEAAGGFVEEDETRPGSECAGDLQSLLHTPGELSRQVVDPGPG